MHDFRFKRSNNLHGIVAEDVMSVLISIPIAACIAGGFYLLYQKLFCGELSNSQDNIRERELLQTIYTRLNGDQWLDKTYWNSEEPLWRWKGVKLGPQGHVVKLILPANNLCGVQRILPALAIYIMFIQDNFRKKSVNYHT